MAPNCYNKEADALKRLSRGGTDFEYDIGASGELVRNLAIIKQGLDKKPESHGKEVLLEAIRRIKLLQLDTISTVDRSHYLVMLSRVGQYDRKDLDGLLYPDRALFEQRSHANCWIPMEAYPFLQPEVLNRRNVPIKQIKLRQMGENPERVLKSVLERIKVEGPVSSRDFAGETGRKHSWWDRKPERVALEALWKRGYLAVDRRTNFQCRYDLAERVIPEKAYGEKHSLEEFKRWAAINGIDAIGIGTAADINDYYRQNLSETRETIGKLVEDGEMIRVKVAGWQECAYALARDAHLIGKLRSNPPELETATLLSPFDNLIWFRDRMERCLGCISG